MALTNDDWIEVLEHTRKKVRKSGFEDVDQRVTLDFRSTEIARLDFINYLSQLINGLSERSISGYEKALRTIRKSVRTENGTPIEGIEIRVTDGDYNLYRARSIDLGELNDDLSELITELTALKRELINIGDLNG